MPQGWRADPEGLENEWVWGTWCEHVHDSQRIRGKACLQVRSWSPLSTIRLSVSNSMLLGQVGTSCVPSASSGLGQYKWHKRSTNGVIIPAAWRDTWGASKRQCVSWECLWTREDKGPRLLNDGNSHAGRKAVGLHVWMKKKFGWFPFRWWVRFETFALGGTYAHWG